MATYLYTEMKWLKVNILQNKINRDRFQTVIVIVPVTVIPNTFFFLLLLLHRLSELYRITEAPVGFVGIGRSQASC